MKAYVVFVIVVGLVRESVAFLAPATSVVDATFQQTTLSPRRLDSRKGNMIDRFSTTLAVNKKPRIQTEEKGEIDYGKILALFVNPANPYSWFLYMLGFIIVYGSISGQ